MKKLLNYSYLTILAFLLISLSGCDKTKEYDIAVPPPEAHFAGLDVQVYATRNTAPYNVVVGTTDVASVDRVVTYKVATPTNAVPGTHFTIATGNLSGSVVIPAGKSTANIPVQGIYAPYNGTGRIDTLVFTLSQPAMTTSTFFSTVKLILTGCDEANVDLTALLGTYAHTNELYGASAYGPYTTTISSATSTGPTSATIVVTNIWDSGWGPISFSLDWSNPSNRTVTVIPQTNIPGSNAGDLNATYAGIKMQVRPFAGNNGTFSICSQTLKLTMQLGPTGVGYFGSLYQVNMAR